MSESAPSGPGLRAPVFWLLAIGGLLALVAVGLVLRSIGDEDADPEASTLAAVASPTPEASPSAAPSPTTTPTPTPSPSRGATEEPTETPSETPTPTDTPTATPSATEQPAVQAAPAPPSSPPPPPVATEEPTAEATEELTAEASPTAEPTDPPAQGDGGSESYAYGEVDRIRAAADVSAVSSNGSLAAVARQWSDSMRQSGALTHNPNVAGQIPSGYVRWAENVAHAATIGEAMRLLEGSSLHYQNMVYPGFTDVGIGVVVDAEGWVWITQVFAQY